MCRKSEPASPEPRALCGRRHNCPSHTFKAAEPNNNGVQPQLHAHTNIAKVCEHPACMQLTLRYPRSGTTTGSRLTSPAAPAAAAAAPAAAAAMPGSPATGAAAPAAGVVAPAAASMAAASCSAAAALGPPASMYASTSPFSTRPPGPVAWTCRRARGVGAEKGCGAKKVVVQPAYSCAVNDVDVGPSASAESRECSVALSSGNLHRTAHAWKKASIGAIPNSRHPPNHPRMAAAPHRPVGPAPMTHLPEVDAVLLCQVAYRRAGQHLALSQLLILAAAAGLHTPCSK